MRKIQDEIWSRLEPTLIDCVRRVARDVEGATWNVTSSSNDSFLLRGFATIQRSMSGGELAIVVDVQKKNSELELSCDVTTDTGKVVSEGPILCLMYPRDGTSALSVLDEYTAEVRKFLSGIQAELTRVASNLPA